MKCFFVLFAAVLVMSEVRADDLTYMDQMVECGNEMGVTPDELKSLMMNKDSKLGCINACVMKKLGGMADGKLNKDNLAAILEKNKDSVSNYAKLQENVSKCYDEVTSGGDLPECDLAGKFVICMHSSM